jgi:hypothetical protein
MPPSVSSTGAPSQSRLHHSLLSPAIEGPAITDEASPFALRSTRNRPRTAVRRGASWTAAYHRQLTVAAVARLVGSSVVRALGVLAAARSWWLLAQAAFARRSVQPVWSGRASSPRSTLSAGRPRRRSPVSSRRCPPIRFRVSGIRLSSRPVSGHLGSSSSGSGGRPSAVHPCGVQPSGVCPVGPDASVSSHAQAVALGTRSRWPGDRDHRNRWRPLGLPSRRRLDRRSRRPGRGRRCRRRVGRWEVAGGPGPPGWVRAAAAALAR